MKISGFLIALILVTSCIQAQSPGPDVVAYNQEYYAMQQEALRAWTSSNQTSRELARIKIYIIDPATTLEIEGVDPFPGWDTGISVTNLTSTETIVISRVEFKDKSGDSSLNVGFGFNTLIGPGQRWTEVVSRIIGVGRDGYLEVHIVSSERASRFTNVRAANWVNPIFSNPLIVSDLTTRLLK